MDATFVSEKGKGFINPYFGGVLLGMVLLLAFYVSGRGLGASGSIKSTVALSVDKVAPAYAEKSDYLGKFISADKNPLNNWLIYESLGIFFGGLLSGALFGRIKKFRVEHPPTISAKTRLIFAGIGGMFFGIGSQFGRGCTSGAALSGTASLSTGGVLTMLMIFGTGYILAYFFRRLWV